MRIIVFTGTRAEFGLLQPVMRAIERRAIDPRGNGSEPSQVGWMASGSHLVSEMGNTIELVRSDPAPIVAEVPFFRPGLSPAINTGNGISAIAKRLEEIRPDWLVVLGDRYESFAATVAASLSGIPVCHIHGGDRANSGHVDECFRHAMTRFAALHCAGSRASADRLLKFGEEPWRVHWVGAPGLDRLRQIASEHQTEMAEFAASIGGPFLLVILHPVSSEEAQAGAQADWLIGALDRHPLRKLVVLPNNDPGGDAIRNRLLKTAYGAGTNAQIAGGKHEAHFRVGLSAAGGGDWLTTANLDSVHYAAALKYARAFVGNSSSGIIEAPIFGLPMVHTGNRNRDRENAGHVQWVDWNDDAGLAAALELALSDSEHARVAELPNPYGDGMASQRIAELLWAFRDNPELQRKLVTY